MSRSPSREAQYIPPFSLWWIGMVHDYWRYVDDPEFVRAMLPGVRAVLDYFGRFEQSNGSLSALPDWSFVDWTDWERGVPPRGAGGSSASIDLQYLLALGWAVKLETALGSREGAAALEAKAAKLASTVGALYWSSERRMYADVPSRSQFSQHANVLAILAGLVKGPEAGDLLRRTLDDPDLTPCSYYFAHYLHEAMALAGEGDRYLESLGPWRSMLDLGLTTWAERPPGARNASRSDCHAWSAGPSVGLFRIVAGVDSAAPGFRRVVIQPSLGHLKALSATIPHPRGQIELSVSRTDTGLSARVVLPSDLEGEFRWQGEQRMLSAGVSTLVFPAPETTHAD
jgi:alpha-L-rhamnosidase